MEGVGWYIGGDPDISAAIKQIADDSDRAVGVLISALTEIRLTEAIQGTFQKPEGHAEAVARLFQVGRGPLSSFDVQIDIAYLLGIISKTAFDDLKIMKGIRNDFAHKLYMLDFSTQSIKDRCLNLKLVDAHLGDLASGKTYSVGGVSEALKTPRGRYIMTAQIISFPLSQHSNAYATRPLI